MRASHSLMQANLIGLKEEECACVSLTELGKALVLMLADTSEHNRRLACELLISVVQVGTTLEGCVILLLSQHVRLIFCTSQIQGNHQQDLLQYAMPLLVQQLEIGPERKVCEPHSRIAS